MRVPGEFHRPPVTRAPSPSNAVAACFAFVIRQAVCTLGIDAMFEALNEPLDFTRSEFRSRDVDRCRTSERRLWRREPFARRLRITLE